MKILMTAALLASSAFVATAADAALLGRQVNGTIQFGANPTNYYDPANGFVPGGFGNSGGQPVTIAAGTEFGFQDGANMDTADFSDTQLTIRDVVFSNAASGSRPSRSSARPVSPASAWSTTPSCRA